MVFTQCTDAAAEGLNFQFCGALVNYDMPWNPMRVEQRIGRIDRLGQDHPAIRIVNLYEEHAESVALWSPGSPLFRPPELLGGGDPDEDPDDAPGAPPVSVRRGAFTTGC